MKNRRRRYLVNNKMQYRIMCLAALPVLFGGAALYYVLYYFIVNEIIIPEAVVQVLFPALKKANFTLLFLVPVFLFVLLRAVLVYSNKIAGPMYRFDRELDQILSTNNFNTRIKFREGDELHPIAEKTNMLLERVQKILTKD